MAKAESFDGLISSIQDAFLSVNRMSEQQHLDTLSEYFDEENNPRTFTVNYPFFGEDGVVEYRSIEIPLFCLVPISSLKINEINVDFKVKLSGKVRLKQATDNNDRVGFCAEKETVGYIPSFKNRGDNDSYANITLKFQAEEPPEGLLRIRDEMIKILP